MSSKHAIDLAEKIQQLQADRQRHAQAMATIDQVLAQIDQALRTVTPPPRPATETAPSSGADAILHEVPPRPVRHRGRFERTGVDSVLDFIRQQANPTTAEINAHWRAEGRKGTANVTLLKLLKDNRIRREEDPTIRGSRYRLAQSGKDFRPAKMEVAAYSK
jgi:hypothetical protein